MNHVHFQLIPPHIRNNLRTACDVGGNRGDWTAGILELAPIESAVVFEPQPSMYSVLQARFETSPKVRCVQAAVGATKGSVTFNVEDATEMSSIRALTNHGRQMHQLDKSQVQTITVPMVTLDDELKDFDEISILKLDVQGYEDQVISGARRTLERCQCLVTEVLYDRDYYEGALHVLELARLIEEVSPLQLSCVSEPALGPAGLGLFADAVFVRKPSKQVVGRG